MRQRLAFTIIEVLISIAVIVTLASIILTAASAAKPDTVATGKFLKELSTALRAYHAQFGLIPPDPEHDRDHMCDDSGQQVDPLVHYLYALPASYARRSSGNEFLGWPLRNQSPFIVPKFMTGDGSSKVLGDAWGMPIAYRRTGRPTECSFVLISAGPDREMNLSDEQDPINNDNIIERGSEP